MSKYLVFGHKNPDTDTIASAIAMSFFLERQGYDAEPVALGTPNEDISLCEFLFCISIFRSRWYLFNSFTCLIVFSLTL